MSGSEDERKEPVRRNPPGFRSSTTRDGPGVLRGVTPATGSRSDRCGRGGGPIGRCQGPRLPRHGAPEPKGFRSGWMTQIMAVTRSMPMPAPQTGNPVDHFMLVCVRCLGATESYPFYTNAITLSPTDSVEGSPNTSENPPIWRILSVTGTAGPGRRVPPSWRGICTDAFQSHGTYGVSSIGKQMRACTVTATRHPR